MHQQWQEHEPGLLIERDPTADTFTCWRCDAQVRRDWAPDNIVSYEPPEPKRGPRR